MDCDPDNFAPAFVPEEAAVFVGALDRNALPADFRADPSVPVVNIVQGLRHVDAADPRHQFLRHRAIRICVSPAVELSLRERTDVNGPILHVPMGIDFSELPAGGEPQADLLIAAVKAPQLGRELFRALDRPDRRVDLLTTPLPRPEFLARMGLARAVILLPLPCEGFFLPALEAMAMQRIVVCPSVPATTAFVRDGENGFSPDYDAASITEAVEQAP